jgi:hypothetical protein
MQFVVAHPTWMKVFDGDKTKEMGVVLSTSEVKCAMMTGEIMESITQHRPEGLAREGKTWKTWRCVRGGARNDALTSLLPLFCSSCCASATILPDRKNWSSKEKRASVPRTARSTS